MTQQNDPSATGDAPDTRRDLAAGVALDELGDGRPLAGRVGDDDVLLLRSGDALYAVGANCTHYSGPLADGLVVGTTIRCPLHHAAFDLRSGEALRAPALDPIGCWRVEQRAGRAYVGERIVAPPPPTRRGAAAADPRSIVIVGGGAAGLAAAEMLRRHGYEHALTMVSADAAPPSDRPNLSKDYLAGQASEDWIPLRPPSFFEEHRIELLLGTPARALDVAARRLELADGRSLAWDALLLATGAEPVRFEIPGAQGDRVHVLRSLADSRAIIARAAQARRVAILGASFIGLEVAASLRERGLEVHVIGREAIPMERVLGAEVGRRIQALHESHGVRFHLGSSIERVDGTRVTLAGGAALEADFIVLGAGVKPALALAEQAGLALDRGVVVDAWLQTSAAGVYAAGDIARWPDPHSGEAIRVEHWAVAETQGQTAALNMLGQRRRYETVPFFWSQHYDTTIRYVGHAERWDRIEVDGSVQALDATLRYCVGTRTLAVATIGRDLESLRCEAAMEQQQARDGAGR